MRGVAAEEGGEPTLASPLLVNVQPPSDRKTHSWIPSHGQAEGQGNESQPHRELPAHSNIEQIHTHRSLCGWTRKRYARTHTSASDTHTQVSARANLDWIWRTKRPVQARRSCRATTTRRRIEGLWRILAQQPLCWQCSPAIETTRCQASIPLQRRRQTLTREKTQSPQPKRPTHLLGLTTPLLTQSTTSHPHPQHC